MKIMQWVGDVLWLIGGIGLVGFSLYGIIWLVLLMIKGLLKSNWLLVIGGGILTYLFIGLLVLGFLFGVLIIFSAIDVLKFKVRRLSTKVRSDE